MALEDGFKFPNMVGSPIDKEIIFLSGWGWMFMVSKMFLIGLKVFFAKFEASTFHSSSYLMKTILIALICVFILMVEYSNKVISIT